MNEARKAAEAAGVEAAEAEFGVEAWTWAEYKAEAWAEAAAKAAAMAAEAAEAAAKAAEAALREVGRA